MAEALSWPLTQPVWEVFQIRPFQTDNPNAHLLRLLHASGLQVMRHLIFAAKRERLRDSCMCCFYFFAYRCYFYCVFWMCGCLGIYRSPTLCCVGPLPLFSLWRFSIIEEIRCCQCRHPTVTCSLSSELCSTLELIMSVLDGRLFYHCDVFGFGFIPILNIKAFDLLCFFFKSLFSPCLGSKLLLESRL